MALFGDLVATVADKELNGLRTQVCKSMVPLLLHLKDQCPAVVTVSANPQAFQLGKGTGQPGQATHRAPQITVSCHTLPCSARQICGSISLQQSMVGYGQPVYLLIRGYSLPYHRLHSLESLTSGEGTIAASSPASSDKDGLSPCLPL